MKHYVNYHCHSDKSNFTVADSAVRPIDYINRIKELGHKAYVSTEHGISYGWVEKYLLCEKHNIKFIYGVEGYIELENGTGHIMLIAKNESGMKSINRALNYAVKNNFYKNRPTLTVEILRNNIEPENVLCTTACVFGVLKGKEGINVFKDLHKIFGDNFYIEVMAHNTPQQIEFNKRAQILSERTGIKLIGATDSHMIRQDQKEERNDLIIVKRGKGYEDEDESGWYLDYPDYDTLVNRFMEQGIWDKEKVEEMLDRTNEMLDYEDIILNKDFKIPTVYPQLSRRERCIKLIDLINEKWAEYSKKVPLEQHEIYLSEIKNELREWFSCKMEDYALTAYHILERGKQKGGVITTTSRGSCSSFLTNMLLGFTTVDRLKAKVPILQERFMTADKIIKSHSTPDIDNNISDASIFYEAQKEILGEDTNYPLVAFGTLKEKSAFRMLCKARGDIPVELQDKMSERIEAYSKDKLYADDDEKDNIKLEDYLDNEELLKLYKDGESYFGITTDLKRHASAFCISNDNIAELFGLCRVPSGDIVLNLEGKYMDELGYVKLDWLIVNVVEMIDLVYKKIGIPVPTAEELYNLVKDDKATWDIYEKGITCCVNQVEKAKTRAKVMKYKPRTVEELCSFIAGIRPAFQSYYSRFEKREKFKFGLETLDNLLQGKYLDGSWILYQEQIMLLVLWLGFEKKESADLMKAISKKKEEKIKMVKSRFIPKCVKEFTDNGFDEEKAIEETNHIWQVIEDASRYGFNASHSFCMSLDSLYIAYAKAHYPEETYVALIEYNSIKKKRDKVYKLKLEAQQFFDIQVAPYRFGQDNRNTIIKDKIIYQNLSSIKNINNEVADKLYSIKDFKGNMYELYKQMLDLKMNKTQIDVLSKIGYFKEFGEIGMWLWLSDNYKGMSSPRLNSIEKYYRSIEDVIKIDYDKLIIELKLIAQKVTKATICFKDKEDFFKTILQNIQVDDIIPMKKMFYEVEYIGMLSSYNTSAIIGQIKEIKKYGAIVVEDARTGETTVYKVSDISAYAKNNIVYIPNVEERHWKRTEKDGTIKQGISYIASVCMNLTNLFAPKKKKSKKEE